MNWEAIGAVGEIIGAAAVVVSLIYLATQVRSSSRATRASVYMGLHDSEAHFISLLLSNPAIRDLYDKIGAGNPEFSTPDRPAASLLLTMMFNKYEQFFFLSREGMFASDFESSMTKIIAKRLRAPDIRTWWEDSKGKFSTDFVNWVDEIRDT